MLLKIPRLLYFHASQTLFQVASGACGASTPVAQPLAASASSCDPEDVLRTVEGLTMRLGTAAPILSLTVKVGKLSLTHCFFLAVI